MYSMMNSAKTQPLHPAHVNTILTAMDPTASDEVRISAIRDVFGDTRAIEAWSQDLTDTGGPTGQEMADVYFADPDCRRLIINAAYAQLAAMPTSIGEYREWAEAIAAGALESINDHQTSIAAALR